MELEPQNHRSAVICTLPGDATIENLVTEAGLNVIGVASSAFGAESMVRITEPDLIVLDASTAGESGFGEVSRLREISPKSQVLLITTEAWRPSDSALVGAYSVITKSKLGSLAYEIGSLVQWLDDEKGRDDDDRRTGRDRRQHQDWHKVGWERRQGPRRD